MLDGDASSSTPPTKNKLEFPKSNEGAMEGTSSTNTTALPVTPTALTPSPSAPFFFSSLPPNTTPVMAPANNNGRSINKNLNFGLRGLELEVELSRVPDLDAKSSTSPSAMTGSIFLDSLDFRNGSLGLLLMLLSSSSPSSIGFACPSSFKVEGVVAGNLIRTVEPGYVPSPLPSSSSSSSSSSIPS